MAEKTTITSPPPATDTVTSGPPSASDAAPATVKPRKRFVGSSSRPTAKKGEGKTRPVPRRVANLIPDEILNDKDLNEAMKGLPSNYSFEIHKTVHQLRRDRIRTVALQMPEGLMIYGPIIADILENYTYPALEIGEGGKYEGMDVTPLLLADVTYGACCIDDFTAKEMGAEMIVHYGHSCLIPVSQTTLKTLYVFVEITIDPIHLALSVRRNFPSERVAFRRDVLREESTPKGKSPLVIGIEGESATERGPTGSTAPKATKVALVSTIQFISAVQDLRDLLSIDLPAPEDLAAEDADADVDSQKQQNHLMRVKAEELGVWRGAYEIVVPQVRPLSPGEVLGCTAPKLDSDVDALIYVGDGRFHLESIMIANPSTPAFRYDPYDKKFTREGYEHEEMRELRGKAVRQARRNVGLDRSGASGWSVVLGTLGRQGSLSVLKSITSSLPESAYPPYLLLLSELSPQKLGLLPGDLLNTFVQTSCPRLSIDWGYAFERPLLSPYEASVALGKIRGWEGLVLDDEKQGELAGQGGYPMDFYSDDSLGPWTPRHGMGRPKRAATKEGLQVSA
ncbi:Diphthamide biosynthesis protein 1 [Naganishia albida]|nr:Diphthamide biosynthesis protein 1 [Naganishia albida]